MASGPSSSAWLPGRARPASAPRRSAVFAVFGTLSLMDFKQLSVGLAVAVLLDATVVRGVLLPSVMTLLGDRNWYLPRGLSRLPKHGGPAGPGAFPAEPAPEPTPVTPAGSGA
jgi:MMPL family